MIENLQREYLNPIDEALGMKNTLPTRLPTDKEQKNASEILKKISALEVEKAEKKKISVIMAEKAEKKENDNENPLLFKEKAAADSLRRFSRVYCQIRTVQMTSRKKSTVRGMLSTPMFSLTACMLPYC